MVKQRKSARMWGNGNSVHWELSARMVKGNPQNMTADDFQLLSEKAVLEEY